MPIKSVLVVTSVIVALTCSSSIHSGDTYREVTMLYDVRYSNHYTTLYCWIYAFCCSMVSLWPNPNHHSCATTTKNSLSLRPSWLWISWKCLRKVLMQFVQTILPDTMMLWEDDLKLHVISTCSLPSMSTGLVDCYWQILPFQQSLIPCKWDPI